MYNYYFSFSESPFENNLDQRFLFTSDDHKEVLAALSYFIKTKKGFAIVCGDVGTGKTMLISSFLRTLPEYVHPIIVANPGVSSLELLRYIGKALKIEVKDRDGILELTDAVKDFLAKAKGLNQQFVLITDEAHLLSDQALEEIRLLSNIETQDQKLLQILLVGQYELSYKLDRPEMRHLRQRININRFLSPLNSFETIQYVDHRLRRVGSNFSTIFKEECGKAIFKMTGGVPRNINQLCDNALLICMGDMQHKVDRKILRKAQEALLTDRLFTPKFVKRTTACRGDKIFRSLVWAVTCTAFFALGIILSQTGFPGKRGQQLSQQVSPVTGGATDMKTASGPQPVSDKKEIPIPLARETSSTAPFGGQTSQNFALPPAVPPDSSLKTLGAANPDLTKSPGNSPGARDKSPEGGPAPGKAASPGLTFPPEQPKKVEELQNAPAQVKEFNSPHGDTLKPASLKWVTKKGETLSTIASQTSRGSEGLGLEAVILNNPEIKKRDLIFPGQVVYLPRIYPNGRTMQLRDNLFYAYYGRYDSADAMKRDISLLQQKGVKCKIIENDGPGGKASHRIVLGGYEAAADLQKALDLVTASNK